MGTKSALTTADTSLQWTAYSGQFARVGVRHRRSRARFRISDLSQEIEEGALAGTADAPVRGNALIAVLKALVLHAIVEVTPRRMFAERGRHVVLRLIEVEVVVFVEEDRLGRVAGNSAGFPYHLRNFFGLRDSVAVEQQKV